MFLFWGDCSITGRRICRIIFLIKRLRAEAKVKFHFFCLLFNNFYLKKIIFGDLNKNCKISPMTRFFWSKSLAVHNSSSSSRITHFHVLILHAVFSIHVGFWFYGDLMKFALFRTSNIQINSKELYQIIFHSFC